MNAFPSSNGPTDLEDEVIAVEDEIVTIQSQIDELFARKSELEMLRSTLLESLKSENQRKKEVELQEYQDQIVDYNCEEFSWSEELKSLALKHWNISKFRGRQLEAINAYLSGRHVFVIAPTGLGKSLCYQLPALLREGITLVISPLVALIHDQVLNLADAGIEAAALTGATDKDEQKEILEAMLKDRLSDGRKSNLKIVYVTPEKIAKAKRFVSHQEKVYAANRLAGLILDEAHCVSQYGHDFRPDYKKLGLLRTLFPKVPMMALTATCPQPVLFSVYQILNLPSHTDPINGTVLLTSSLHRDNLYYEVRPKPSAAASHTADIIDYIQTKWPTSRGIIYCFTKKECDTLSESLIKSKIRCGVYHADLNDASREMVHRQWRAGSILVVVATIAFGMGINQPDVRFVIHHTMSKSVEGYYQESGRAGRDGLRSECILYYRGADLARLSSMVVGESEGLKGCYGMVRYCSCVDTCRRTLMVRYFGQSGGGSAGGGIAGEQFAGGPEDGRCNNCDFCCRPDDLKVVEEDITEQALHACRILRALKNKEDTKVTLLKLTEVWRGVGKKFASIQSLTSEKQITIPPEKYHKNELEIILMHLLLESFLKEDFHFTPVTMKFIRGDQGEKKVKKPRAPGKKVENDDDVIVIDDDDVMTISSSSKSSSKSFSKTSTKSSLNSASSSQVAATSSKARKFVPLVPMKRASDESKKSNKKGKSQVDGNSGAEVETITLWD